MKAMILAISFLCLFNGCTQKSEPATYYLPQGFEGVFAIVYNQKDGKPKVIKDGRRQFYIPENGILVTQFNFSDGWRDDLFLVKTSNGYDTLKNYLPKNDTTGKKFDAVYYKTYTRNSDEYAVNFRQIRKSTFNKFNAAGDKAGSCSFEYEIVTVGRANYLNDSIGEAFIDEVDKYLQETYCN